MLRYTCTACPVGRKFHSILIHIIYEYQYQKILLLTSLETRIINISKAKAVCILFEFREINAYV